MAKTIRKKSVVKKKSVAKKSPKRQDDNSMGIMLLAGFGLILLIYFGSTVNVDVEIDMGQEKNANDTELVEEGIVISGKSYSSKKQAKNMLTGLPQSQLTDEEIKFVESYRD
tara:strand:+ start:1226 stop:1561 length:336 start_codon:yes stop_codon:yes gene_type:complete